MTLNKPLTLLPAMLMVAFISACSKEPPKCSDEGTFSLVREIILEQIGGKNGLSEAEVKANMQIAFPRASAYDEKIKKYSCEAKLIVGGAIELPITYASQLDDNNEQIVSVSGISTNDLFAVQAAMLLSIQKSKSDKNDAQKPGTSSDLSFTQPNEIKLPLKTRFGMVSINEEKILLLNGQPLSPTIQGNSSLYVADHNEGGQSDVLLIEDVGGTACPAQYYFVSLSSTGATQSRPFGTCSDLIKTAKKGDEIIVSMPGASENENHIYSLSGSNVLDNGKLMK